MSTAAQLSPGWLLGWSYHTSAVSEPVDMTDALQVTWHVATALKSCWNCWLSAVPDLRCSSSSVQAEAPQLALRMEVATSRSHWEKLASLLLMASQRCTRVRGVAPALSAPEVSCKPFEQMQQAPPSRNACGQESMYCADAAIISTKCAVEEAKRTPCRPPAGSRRSRRLQI